MWAHIGCDNPNCAFHKSTGGNVTRKCNDDHDEMAAEWEDHCNQPDNDCVFNGETWYADMVAWVLMMRKRHWDTWHAQKAATKKAKEDADAARKQAKRPSGITPNKKMVRKAPQVSTNPLRNQHILDYHGASSGTAAANWQLICTPRLPRPRLLN
jgi:hypothetical protein